MTQLCSKEADFSPPDQGEAEICVFGPGFGESILLHCGNNEWMLIDSCILGSKKDSCASIYLKKLNLDESVIHSIFLTHWHDDHIKGIGQFIEKCQNTATLHLSSACNDEKFKKHIKQSPFQDISEKVESGICEIMKIFREIEEPKMKRKFVSPNQTLFNNENCEVIALSPTHEAARQAMDDLLKERVGRYLKKMPLIKPNKTSIVLLVKLKQQKKNILLGADLEKNGWEEILDDAVSKGYLEDAQCMILKVPHHASDTAYYEPLWGTLAPSPYLVVTPFNRNIKPLPREIELNKLFDKTPNLWVTSGSKGSDSTSLRSHSKEAEKILNKRENTTINKDLSFVRFRFPNVNEIKVELFGRAYKFEGSSL